MMALDTEIMFLHICNQRHKFSFYSLITQTWQTCW